MGFDCVIIVDDLGNRSFLSSSCLHPLNLTAVTPWLFEKRKEILNVFLQSSLSQPITLQSHHMRLAMMLHHDRLRLHFAPCLGRFVSSGYHVGSSNCSWWHPMKLGSIAQPRQVVNISVNFHTNIWALLWIDWNNKSSDTAQTVFFPLLAPNASPLSSMRLFQLGQSYSAAIRWQPTVNRTVIMSHQMGSCSVTVNLQRRHTCLTCVSQS